MAHSLRQGFQFRSPLLCLQSGFLLGAAEDSPGTESQAATWETWVEFLAMVSIWRVSQQMESLSLLLCLSSR